MTNQNSTIDLIVTVAEIAQKVEQDNTYYRTKNIPIEWIVYQVINPNDKYEVVISAINKESGKKLWTSFDKNIYESTVEETKKFGFTRYKLAESVALSDEVFSSRDKSEVRVAAHNSAQDFAKSICKAIKGVFQYRDERYNLDARSDLIELQPESIEHIKRTTGIEFRQTITVESQLISQMGFGYDMDQHNFILDKGIKEKCGGNDYTPGNANAYIIRKEKRSGKVGDPFVRIEYVVDCYSIDSNKLEDIRMRGKCFRSESQRLIHDKPPREVEDNPMDGLYRLYYGVTQREHMARNGYSRGN